MPGLLDRPAVPGVAIALVHGPHIQWSSGFGVVSPNGESVSAGTIFQAASLGKPLFAEIVNSLSLERSWTLEHAVESWAPAGSYRADLGSVTAAALLSHTAGLVYDPVADRVTLDPHLRGRWQYSGAGYLFLQRMIEAAEHQGLETLASARWFGPLGLQTMSFLAPASGSIAEGHDRNGRAIHGMEWEEANAASSLYASAHDYARFLINAAGLGSVAEPASLHLAMPQVAVSEDLGLFWGFGWALERDAAGDVTAFHWGSNPGFKSFAMVDRTREIGLVILTNGDNGLELAEDVLRIIDPKPHPLFGFYMLHPDD
jgi:CubicO group peptidase (beta-lactamase class C family)